MVIQSAVVFCVLLWTVAAWGQGAADTVRSSADGAPATTSAQDAERARQAFLEGLNHLRSEEWAAAETSFRRSLEIVRRESAVYNLALVLYKQRRPKESLSLLSELLRPGDAGSETDEAAKYRGFAEKLLPHVRAQVSTLKLAVAARDARVWVDGEPIRGTGGSWTAELDPGAHRVDVAADGFHRSTVELVLKPGSELRESIALAPSSEPWTSAPPLPMAKPIGQTPTSSAGLSTIAPWVVIGTGGAALVTGFVFGVMAHNADSKFIEQCPKLKDCNPDLQGLAADAERYGRVSDVLLISGAVLVTGGIVWRVESTPPSAGASAKHVLELSGRF